MLNQRRKIYFSSILVLVVLVFFPFQKIVATTVTSANDYPSTLVAGESANHLLLFTTTSGIDEGDTVTITFASSFETSTLTENDVDLADDSVALTTASDCSGTEQASISIVGDILTITVCSGDGGAIAIGSEVQVDIGTSATESGTGVNQITNPSSVGSYFVSLAGTCGDTGSIILPIGSEDVVSVSATVPGGESPSGGGGGETPSDTTAPVISSVIVSGVTASTATITWATSESATSLVQYGLSSSFGSTVSFPYTYVTSHSVSLSSLAEATSYYFQVKSTDVDGNTATSSTYTFSTSDVTAPIISEIEVVDITTTSARVTWTTNEDANSILEYGLTEAYGQTSQDASFETAHSLILTGLSVGATYHFVIQATDVSGNIQSSSDQTFFTDVDPAPSNISDLSVTSGDGSLSLSWTNPTDVDLEGIYAIICTDAYPSSSQDVDCVPVFDGLFTSYFLSGLVNGTTYYLGLFAYDQAGQFASGALGSGIPSEPEEELPSEEPEEELPEEDQEEELPESEPSIPSDEEQPSEGSTGDTYICGDGICSLGETASFCPNDCSESEETSPEGEVESALDEGDVQFFVADGTIALTATSSGVLTVLADRELLFQLPLSVLEKVVDHIEIEFSEEHYLLALETDGQDRSFYLASVTTPQTSGEFPLLITVFYSDETQEVLTFSLDVEGFGYTFEVLDGEIHPVSEAKMTLFVLNGDFSVWDGSPYGQINPQYTSVDGVYAWYVPLGTYYVRAEHEGYEIAQTSYLTVTNGLINNPIQMSTLFPEEGMRGSGEEDVSDFFTQTGSQIDAFRASIDQTVTDIRELPGVEEVAIISVPALAVTAGASLILISVAFDFLPFLQYLFLAPVLFFWRRKRKGFGVVYNAISKTPIDLATVRLYEMESRESTGVGKLVKTRVTDREGRYFFLAKPGFYKISFTKKGFVFPSTYLSGERQDGDYLDLYHQEIIEVTETNAVITANIPVDPSQEGSRHKPARVRFLRTLRHIQYGLSVSGVFLAILFAILRPTYFSAGMIVVQLIVYLFVRRLARPHKHMNWGIVYNKQTGRPLGNVVARVFEPKFNKLIETQVTDSQGRYAFLLGPNQYFVRFEKPGFVREEIRPIDFSKEKSSKDFALDVSLKTTQENQKPESISSI